MKAAKNNLYSLVDLIVDEEEPATIKRKAVDPPTAEEMAEEEQFNAEAEQFEGPSALKETATPESMMLRDEIQNVIFSAIEALPDDLRTAITLRELEDMSYNLKKVLRT